jgi:hypothetical protein
LNEIKTTAEELADGFQSQMEGRKSLKLLREEVSLAETACAAAQVALVTVSKETQLAEVGLRDAGGPKRAAGEVTRRAETARASLVIARSAFSAARAETQRREDALRAAEIALAESLEKRNLIHLLWKRNHLTPEETETQRLLLEEARRLNAALSIQRNFRAVLEKRRAKERAAERRKKMNASVVRGVKTLGSFVLLYLVLSVFGKACSGAWNARHAAAEKVTNAIDQVTNAARLLTPLDHGYLRSGLGSRDNIGEHLGLRDRNRVLHETIDVLEVELRRYGLHLPNPASTFDHAILTLFWQNGKAPARRFWKRAGTRRAFPARATRPGGWTRRNVYHPRKNAPGRFRWRLLRCEPWL